MWANVGNKCKGHQTMAWGNRPCVSVTGANNVNQSTTTGTTINNVTAMGNRPCNVTVGPGSTASTNVNGVNQTTTTAINCNKTRPKLKS